jgi:hypothetical protein
MELAAFAHPGSFHARHPTGILRHVAGGRARLDFAAFA